MTEGAHFYKSTLSSGHSAAVLCVHWRRPDGVVVTGSEDASCRIWDTRTKRSVKRIGKVFGTNAVTSVVFDPSNAHLLYASSGNQAFKFDIRSTNVLVNTAIADLSVASGCDINELDIHHSGKFLAAADDNGMVSLFDTNNLKRKRVLRGKHLNICSSVKFRPHAAWNLSSGAMDSSLVCWDFQTGRALCVHKVGALEADANEAFSTSGVSQSFNPPLVHSLSYSSDGRYTAAGIGDSTVGIYRHGKENHVFRFVAHKAPVCTVSFFRDTSLVAGQQLLISASTDKTLRGWKIPLDEGAAKGKSVNTGEKNGMASLKPGCQFVLPLEHKPNWVDTYDKCVALADTTTEVSLYRMR